MNGNLKFFIFHFQNLIALPPCIHFIIQDKRKAEENSSGSSSSSKKTKTVENDEEEDEDDDEPKLVPEALDCIDSSNIIARVPRRSALASGLGTKSSSSHVTPARKSVAKDDDDEEAEF